MSEGLAGEASGLFWTLAGKPVPGVLTAEGAEPAVVDLEGALSDDPRVSVVHQTETAYRVAHSGGAAKQIASFAPRTLHGELESGELVSLIRAQNHGGTGYDQPPRFTSREAIFGAHVEPDQVYTAVRFRLDHPYWTSHLCVGSSARVPDDGAVLSVASSSEKSDGHWLVYEAAKSETLRRIERRAISACRVLASLVLDLPVVCRSAEVRIGSDDVWLRIHGPQFSATPGDVGHSFIVKDELTLERFAGWIEFNWKLEGLSWAVAQPTEGAVQVKALLGTSLIEGIHQRLPDAGSRFPGISRDALDKARKAARAAAADSARGVVDLDPNEIRNAVREAVAHIDKPTYSSRVRAVLSEVEEVAPELIATIPDLAARITKCRNDLAHHSVGNRPYEARFEEWIAISHVIPWILRLLLIRRAGIPAEIIVAACSDSTKFAFACENARVAARNLGWVGEG